VVGDSHPVAACMIPAQMVAVALAAMAAKVME
jgi:hypothetical protein